VRVENAAQPGHGRADHRGEHEIVGYVDADRFGQRFVLPERHQRPTDP